MNVIKNIADFTGRWFALLVLGGAVLGLLLPAATAHLAPYSPLLLAIIMFGMGLTMRPADFAIVVRHPRAVLLGVLAQYTVMPA
jgi:BASS family bile acid:Na+ symporter